MPGHEAAVESITLPAIRLNQGLALLQATLTVLCFYLAFPGGPAPWLGWMAMAPLGIAISRLQPRQAMLLTFLCAFFGWLVSTWWVVPGLSLAARSPVTVTIPFALLFCLFYALPYAIAAWLSVRNAWMGSHQGAFKAALAWTVIPYSVPHLLPGNLAHTQYTYPLAIQVVDLAGVPLLLFLMHWVNWLLVAAWVQRKSRTRVWLFPLASATIILLAVCCYGGWRLAQIDTLLKDPSTPQLSIGIMQPNLPVTGREREDWLSAAPRLEAMSRQLKHRHPDTELIVWPEIPTPFSYSGYTQDKLRIDRLIQDIQSPLLLTDFIDSTSVTESNKPKKYFNSMELVSTEGHTDIYLKQQLLPFGEYIPGEDTFPYLRKLFPSALNYVPGNGSRLFSIKSGISIIPMICYEAVFPDLTRTAVEMGGNLLINTVNDAWFQGSHGLQIHLALALFRSVEFRVPLVRVTNSGISAMIDTGGRIVTDTQLPAGLPAAHSQRIAVPAPYSFYAVIGDRFVWLIGILLAFYLITNPVRRSHLASRTAG
ncbi:MAG: apolipoprotein N-acyltransferase [Gammaproteobacteria bacterium]|nr:apolipoprotein N-acyltransferase [Gammaproteobacteria bacterium]